MIPKAIAGIDNEDPRRSEEPLSDISRKKMKKRSNIDNSELLASSVGISAFSC